MDVDLVEAATRLSGSALVAGRGSGTIKTGRFLEYAEPTDLSSLHLSLLQRMGLSIDSFGTADGPLRELAG